MGVSFDFVHTQWQSLGMWLSIIVNNKSLDYSIIDIKTPAGSAWTSGSEWPRGLRSCFFSIRNGEKKDLGVRLRCPFCITVILLWTSHHNGDGRILPLVPPFGGVRMLHPWSAMRRRFFRRKVAFFILGNWVFTARLAVLFFPLVELQVVSIASAAVSLYSYPIDNRWARDRFVIYINIFKPQYNWWYLPWRSLSYPAKFLPS